MGNFLSIFQFAIYSPCLSSINGPFSCFFQYLFIMFIVYKWAIFIHFPVRYLFIMRDVYHLWMGNFYPFSSSLFIHHVYHQWAIFMHFPVRYLSCLSSMGRFHPFSSSLFIHHAGCLSSMNGQFSCFFQFAIYSSCLSSINGPFSCIFQFAIYSSCLSSMGHFHAFSSSLFIHHVYHQWAIFMLFPARYLFIMFITINGPFSCIFQFAIYSSGCYSLKFFWNGLPVHRLRGAASQRLHNQKVKAVPGQRMARGQ